MGLAADWTLLDMGADDDTLTREQALARPAAPTSPIPARPRSALLSLISTDQEWRADAACKGMDPDLFFPERGDAGSRTGDEAKAVCAGCPVATECLAYALEAREVHGVWGGKSERQRRVLRGQVKTRTCRWCRQTFTTSTGGGTISYCGDDCRRAVRAAKRAAS